jgi:hypothetical protein
MRDNMTHKSYLKGLTKTISRLDAQAFYLKRYRPTIIDFRRSGLLIVIKIKIIIMDSSVTPR